MGIRSYPCINKIITIYPRGCKIDVRQWLKKIKKKMDEITKEINILINKLEALEQALRQESAARNDEKIRRPRQGEVVLLEKSGNLWRVVERRGSRGWRKSP
jgi:hypothetical protein